MIMILTYIYERGFGPEAYLEPSQDGAFCENS